MRVSGCCLLRNVTGSTFTSYYLRGCINLWEVANLPAASLLLPSFVRLRSFASLYYQRFAPWRSVYASSMLFRHPSTAFGFGLFVGNAVAPAIFNDLANIYATLGSYFWLGFITTGLSPDKKRLALLGAQRSRPGDP